MVMNLDETDTRISWFSSRYVLQYISVHQISTRIMYDDYDLDYTFAQDYNLDEDALYEFYAQLDAQDLDEDYARDTQDYNTLAYQHYA